MSNPGVIGLGPRFRDLLDAGPVAGLDDAQLLARFLGGRGPASELAFAAIVARHGPMVLGVCRRACLDPDDAADAFQATFLVLVRRARSVRVDDSLGRWLYGVSRRVARRARVRAGRRRMVEAGPAPLDQLVGPDHDPARPIHRREQRATLDEEIARLPAAFRAAVVLCDLEGRSIEAAAHALGCPVGTVKSRLARGRSKLRDRLERRGIAPAVPVALAEATTRAAVLLKLTPSLAAGMIPVATLSLAQEVVTAMTMVPMKWLGSAVLVSALTTGAVFGRPEEPAAKPSADAPVATPDPVVPPTDAINAALRKMRGLIDAPNIEQVRGRTLELQQAQAELEAAIARGQQLSPEPVRQDSPGAVAPDYVVRPADVLDIGWQGATRIPSRGDLLESILGRKVVGADGQIRLGAYGNLSAAGLTANGIKLRLLLHLRKYFSDEYLGFTRVEHTNNRETGEPQFRIKPDNDRLTVKVIRSNTEYYEVAGDVDSPGRRPLTERETVLDAIQEAGGVRAPAMSARIVLVRPDSTRPNGPGLTFPVNLDAIIERGDSSTNYRLIPGDRLIVSRPRTPAEESPAPKMSPDVETRLRAVEQKLDAMIEALDRLPKP